MFMRLYGRTLPQYHYIDTYTGIYLALMSLYMSNILNVHVFLGYSVVVNIHLVDHSEKSQD